MRPRGAANPGCSRLSGGLLRARMQLVSGPRDAPDEIVFHSCERVFPAAPGSPA
jgi:hypothetical protein